MKTTLIFFCTPALTELKAEQQYEEYRERRQQMTKITESAIETFAIELLEKQGYQYIYGPDIAPDAQERPPDSETSARASFKDVLLLDKLKSAVCPY